MDPLEEKFRLGNTANDNQIDDNELSELTNATGTNLQNLNEDCLLEIFSNDSFTLMDLCSVAETCTRFKEITQRLFTKGFEIKSREFLSDETSYVRMSCLMIDDNESPVPRRRMENRFDFESQHGHHCCRYLLQDVERILKNFGQNLRELELLKKRHSTVWQRESVFTLAGREVNVNGNLRSVLSHFESFDLNSVFQPLLELSLDHCDLLEHSHFNGDSLTQLNIIDCDNYDAVLQRTFPSLTRFTWKHYQEDNKRKKNILFDFIKRHAHLQTITFSDTTIGNYVINVINSSCKKLEELTIQSIERRNSSCFSNLESLAKTLKMLDLQLEYKNIDQYIPLLQAMKSLEEIRFRYMHYEEDALVPLFTVLPQLQNLRKLHLMNCPLDRIPWSKLTRLTELHLSGRNTTFGIEGLPNVVTQLINLEKFERIPHCWPFSSDFQFCSLSSDDFLKIVKIVERREHVLTLKCDCNFNRTEHCEVDQKVRLIWPDYSELLNQSIKIKCNFE